MPECKANKYVIVLLAGWNDRINFVFQQLVQTLTYSTSITTCTYISYGTYQRKDDALLVLLEQVAVVVVEL